MTVKCNGIKMLLTIVSYNELANCQKLILRKEDHYHLHGKPCAAVICILGLCRYKHQPDLNHQLYIQVRIDHCFYYGLKTLKTTHCFCLQSICSLTSLKFSTFQPKQSSTSSIWMHIAEVTYVYLLKMRECRYWM